MAQITFYLSVFTNEEHPLNWMSGKAPYCIYDQSGVKIEVVNRSQLPSGKLAIKN